MAFDVPTALVIAALVGLMLTLLQALAGWRLNAPPLFCWAAATLFTTFGSLFIALRPAVGLVPSVVIANGCALVGMGLIYSGIRIYDGHRPQFAVVGLVALLGVAALLLSLSWGDNLADRISIMSILVAGWAATSGSALLETPGAGPLISRLASVIVLLLVAAAYAARGIGAQFGIFAMPASALPSPVEAPVVLLGIGLFTAWTFGSLFMVLERLASLDDLTGLLNRRATLQRGADLLRTAQARCQPFSLLLADLDHFKQVNDRYGHDVGDEVLRRFARVVRHAVRPGDVIGRHGGEEFCVLLPGADQTGAAVTGERLRGLVQQQLRAIAGNQTDVTLTVGTASYLPRRPSFETIPAMIAAADAALYAAKRQGRNRVAAAPLLDEPSLAPGPAGPQIAAQPLR